VADALPPIALTCAGAPGVGAVAEAGLAAGQDASLPEGGPGCRWFARARLAVALARVVVVAPRVALARVALARVALARVALARVVAVVEVACAVGAACAAGGEARARTAATAAGALTIVMNSLKR
jgi:hypothetical protein